MKPRTPYQPPQEPEFRVFSPVMLIIAGWLAFETLIAITSFILLKG
jgi:hypothetical protein